MNSGHRFNSTSSTLSATSQVSIPLNSGHRFNLTGDHHDQGNQVSIPLNSGHRFNPRHASGRACTSGLNPFEFRASIQSIWKRDGKLVLGLNPFEFRASIQSTTGWPSLVRHSLNPFEFRASIQSMPARARPRHAVSIPLNSGHRFNLCCQAGYARRVSLNPFEFRASIQCQSHCLWD